MTRPLSLLSLNIGTVLKAKRSPDKALDVYQKALAIQLKRLGPDHPNTKQTKANIEALSKP